MPDQSSVVSWTQTGCEAHPSWQAERERLRRLFEHAPGFMCVLRGAEHRFELANAAFLRLVGSRDLLDRPLREALPDLDGQGFYELLDRVYTTGEPVIAHGAPVSFQAESCLEPERRFVDVVYQPITDEEGRIAGIFIQGADVTAAKRAMDELCAERDRSWVLFESTVDVAIIITDSSGSVTDWNTGAEHLFGWRSEEMRGQTVEPLFTPEDRRTAWPASEMRQSLDAGRAFGERWFLHKDGSRFWASSELMRLRDESGAHRGFLRIVCDRTRQRVAEEALHAHEERLQHIAAHIRDYAILTTDVEGQIDTWLPGAEAMFGWSAEETVGQPVAMIFTREDRAAGLPDEERKVARREGVAPDLRWHRRKDNSCLFIEGSVMPLRDLDGAIRGFIKIGQDVTARRRAEDGNARLAAIVTSTTDAIISFAAGTGCILSWNRGAEELFGYTEAEAIGAPVGLLVPRDQPDADPTGVFRRAMDGQRVHEHETVRMTKAGERVAVSVTASQMLAADGRVIGIAGIFRDIRHRKAAEERQALLAREVDHRAKNALAVVQSIVQLTRDRDPAEFKHALSGRISALARAQTLLAKDRWSGADLHTLLVGELAPFLGERRAELDGPMVTLPPGAAQPMAMAVHELATNALKYGALSVAAGRLSVSWRLAWRPNGVPLLQLRWVEAGGPSVAGAPERRGFGSRVLDGTLRSQLGGQVSLMWEVSGLVCEVEVPLKDGVESDATAASHSARCPSEAGGIRPDLGWHSKDCAG